MSMASLEDTLARDANIDVDGPAPLRLGAVGAGGAAAGNPSYVSDGAAWRNWVCCDPDRIDANGLKFSRPRKYGKVCCWLKLPVFG